MADSLQSLLGVLKTGDIVLMAPPALLRWLPGRFGRRSWQRVALVVRDVEHDEPMIWEVAPAGAAGPGVRLRRLVKRLQQHPGRIAVRRLNPQLKSDQCGRLAAWRSAVAAQRQDDSLLDLMGAGEDGWLGDEQAAHGTPLSGELVAQAYQRLGLLDGPERRGRSARDYVARDFGEREGLELKRGFALGPEILLSGEPPSRGWEKLTAQPV